LIPELLDLLSELDAMLRKDDDGKVRLDKSELKSLGKTLLRLGGKILLDIID
jgi:hypothetical protein